MIWPATYADRLAHWHRLRSRVTDLPAAEALTAVNQWWMNTPWTAYHLHWDDQSQWPDPWQMLQDNVFCGLARALGISYTVGMLDRADLADAVLAECDGDNLVLIQQAKYVLNWDRDSIVNITPGRSVPRRQIQLCALLDRIN